MGPGTRAVGIVLLGLLASGCRLLFGLSEGECEPGIGYSIYGGSPLTAPDELGTDGNAFVRIRNRKGGEGAFGTVSTPFDLRAPFRWEVHFGTFDPKSPGSGTGVSLTRLDVRGSDPPQFFALCVRKEPGGYACWAATQDDALVDSISLSGTGIVQAAVEHDGDSVHFLVKKPSDPGWTEIADVPHSPGGPLVPGIGFREAPAGAQGDFDEMRIVFNGPLPEEAPVERVLARAVQDAGMPLAEAAREIDGGGIDLQAAADHIEEAVAALQTAEAAVAGGAETLPVPAAGAKAVRAIRAARKGAEKAGKALEKGKSFKPISLGLQKAMAKVFEAVQALDPHALPGG